MTATLMQVLDSNMANVALPYMQGALSASSVEVTWVLTSYVMAAAIMTAPVGWLAVRYGRKNLFIACLAGFTGFSMLAGGAHSLEQMVIFRVLQGVCGAALVPLSQATMLDIYSFEQRAHAMAIFGIGVMLGPILGPTLGGYLTEIYNWRYVFYVNFPLGILAIIGLLLFMPRTPVRADLRFDWTGFSVLALGIGSLQLMLDRGSGEDWFTSREIIIEAILAGLGLYLFTVHMLTAEKPFVAPAVFKDRNFITCVVLMLFGGSILMSSSALLAPFLQKLAGYPIATAGLTMAPRGFGVMAGMIFASRAGGRLDQRKIMGFGLVGIALSMLEMSSWSPDISARHVMVAVLAQGVCIGCFFNPMTVMAFTTLPSSLRGDGTALHALARNIGAAVGISITTFTLAHDIQVLHEEIGGVITPFHRALIDNVFVTKWLNPATGSGAQFLDNMVQHQAQIIAYSNDYRMLAFSAVPPMLLLFLLRRAAQPRVVGGEEHRK
ncbi:MAG: DHA2 family efflux MFS transporter permease subunit [Acetobacteraceae bacterium]|nr:DHA2 family efflux MFS transporter permease subunit [Acetobacteraceae bacterium]MSP29011.1 DHA2 family efflux MFS transporter permease subunit [Acetobacteraceae bacterium]